MSLPLWSGRGDVLPSGYANNGPAMILGPHRVPAHFAERAGRWLFARRRFGRDHDGVGRARVIGSPHAQRRPSNGGRRAWVSRTPDPEIAATAAASARWHVDGRCRTWIGRTPNPERRRTTPRIGQDRNERKELLHVRPPITLSGKTIHATVPQLDDGFYFLSGTGTTSPQ